MTNESDRRDREVVPFAVGDTLSLHKQHPCGGNEWVVYRVGADLGLRCTNCGRRVMLDRFVVQRRMRSRNPG